MFIQFFINRFQNSWQWWPPSKRMKRWEIFDQLCLLAVNDVLRLLSTFMKLAPYMISSKNSYVLHCSSLLFMYICHEQGWDAHNRKLLTLTFVVDMICINWFKFLRLILGLLENVYHYLVSLPVVSQVYSQQWGRHLIDPLSFHTSR